MEQNKFKTVIATTLFLIFFAFTIVPSIVVCTQNSSTLLLVNIPEEDNQDAQSKTILKLTTIEFREFICFLPTKNLQYSNQQEFLETLHHPTPVIPPPEYLS